MRERPAVLIGEARIQTRVRELAAAVRQDVPSPASLHLVAALKGAFIFLADLMRALEGPLTCDFLGVGSYGAGTESTGQIRLTKDLEHDVAGLDVLLVEDVVDTGLTVSAIQRLLLERRPRSLRTVALLDKPARRQADVSIDYVGFTIENRFVVGYGLDLDQHYRHLPYIGVLEEGA